MFFTLEGKDVLSGGEEGELDFLSRVPPHPPPPTFVIECSHLYELGFTEKSLQDVHAHRHVSLSPRPSSV